jgi:hypothetical protein
MPNLNGSRIVRQGNTTFVVLPEEMWRSCGKCICQHCQGREGMWDTLAISQVKSDGTNDHAWTVHYPSITGSAAIIHRRMVVEEWMMDIPSTIILGED